MANLYYEVKKQNKTKSEEKALLLNASEIKKKGPFKLCLFFPIT